MNKYYKYTLKTEDGLHTFTRYKDAQKFYANNKVISSWCVPVMPHKCKDITKQMVYACMPEPGKVYPIVYLMTNRFAFPKKLVIAKLRKMAKQNPLFYFLEKLGVAFYDEYVD